MKTILFLVIFALVISVLVLLPDIEINKDEVVSSSAFTYIRAAMYFIPAGTVFSILGIILALWTFRVIVAVVKVIWDLLPIA